MYVFRYSELLEGMQSISPDKMPKLGPYIHPPSLYQSQEVYCVLTLRIFIARPQGSTTTTTTTTKDNNNNIIPEEKESEENSKQQLCQVDTRYISVVCNLDIPSEL